MTETAAQYVVPTPDRRTFLGGSDAAAVMGLSPWKTPVELWRLKTGKVEPEGMDPARRKILERGHKLEPFIRDMAVDKLRDEYGLEVEVLAINERYNDPEHPFLACEIDFELRLTGQVTIGEVVHVFDGEHVNADAKSVGSFFARKKWGETDSEDVPIEYAAQFMHGLMVTGRRYCLVAALRSFDDVELFWTVRDEETVAAMRPKLVEFWVDHVLADVPPDPIKFSDIKLLFPLDNGEATEATDEIVEKLSRLRQVKQEIKALTDEEDVLTFDIGDFISPNARLTYQGADLASWKAQVDTRVNNDALKEAEIYVRSTTDVTGYERITSPIAHFSRSKTIRVLRLLKPKAAKAKPTGE